MLMNAAEDFETKPGASLAIGAGLRGHFQDAGKAPPGVYFTDALAAGGIRREDLSQKGPESDQGRVDALPAVGAAGFWSEQGVGDHGTKGGAELGEGAGGEGFGL